MKSSFSSESLLQLNKRYMPIILGIAAFFFLLDRLLISFGIDQSLLEVKMVEIIILTDLIMLPTVAVNGIFFFQYLFRRTIQSGWKMIALKILATILSVTFMSSILESIYFFGFDYLDDDYIVYGDYKLHPSISNVIGYMAYSLIIGLPIFIWQLRIEELQFKLKENKVEQERLTQLKTQAELHALQSQINPHFLFNSFNSIASLIHSNPHGAENMMIQLSELFRYSLNSQESVYVTIEEELRIVKTYLAIEKVRFGDNLDYQIKVDADLQEKQIPRFLIQPLVENAVKHGISKIKQGELLIEILKEDDQSLSIKIYDNGAPFPESIEKGYGLKSTFDKLELLYPNQYRIAFINIPTKHIHIIIESSDE